MNGPKTLCPSCEAKKNGSVDITDLVQDMRSRLPQEKQCEDHIYLQRIAACLACKELMLPYTCRVCGCIVYLRAISRDAYCPNSREDGWKNISNQT
ncbi:MAG: DUF6171 family protein [Treponema sp.]|nr:DUF6171 family protein [Treponema sp.]